MTALEKKLRHKALLCVLIFASACSPAIAAEELLPAAAAVSIPEVLSVKMTAPFIPTELKTFESAAWYPVEFQEQVAKELLESCARAKVTISEVTFLSDKRLKFSYQSKGQATIPYEELRPTQHYWKKESTARAAMEKIRRKYEKHGFCFVYQEVYSSWRNAVWTYSLEAVY